MSVRFAAKATACLKASEKAVLRAVAFAGSGVVVAAALIK